MKKQQDNNGKNQKERGKITFYLPAVIKTAVMEAFITTLKNPIFMEILQAMPNENIMIVIQDMIDIDIEVNQETANFLKVTTM